jgi:hypothetical protein
MKLKFPTPIFVLAFMLFCTIVAAQNAQPNWQLAYKNDVTSFYFDTNTVKTIGSSDIINADLKVEVSKTRLQELIGKYKDSYNTTSWNKITYSISTTVYNQATKTVISKNYRFFDSNNNLVATIPDEEKRVVSADSVESKIYAAIFEWLYEN